MTRHLVAAAAMLAAAMLAAASPLAASVPPSISVKVVSDDGDAQAMSRALVELLASYNNFQWAPSSIPKAAVVGCLGGGDLVSCARQLVRGTQVNPQAPPVLVIARSAGEGRIAWTCIGAGETASSPNDQSIVIDLKAITTGSPASRGAARRGALQCIWAAAAEAGGVIRIP